MRRPMVAGNWKMNGSRADVSALVNGIKAGADSGWNVDIVLCPPFIYIPQVADALGAGATIGLGGQTLDTHESGAYTGEVAGPMLVDHACKYVIVGHSERRSIYGEADDLVGEKVVAAQQFGLIPILCVGESLEERESNQTEAVVARQLDAVIAQTGIAAFSNMVVAYEPVWAIGTGKVATPEQAQDVHAFIRRKLAAQNSTVAENLRILYGGSVKGSNATGLFVNKDIDGGLIGGAALQADDFLAICAGAANR